MTEILETPLGRVSIEETGGIVQEVHVGVRRPPTGTRSRIAQDLAGYFAGRPVELGGYQVDLSRFTHFERKVYEATRAIPLGEVRTYGEIAKSIGNPRASRAVGNALAKNPACIVIPCHRVVATNGLGGFTGGLAWKRRLLHLEGALK